MGLGGAYVAVCRDSSAIYWNPAALALAPSFEARVPAGVRIGLPDGLLTAIKDAYDLGVARDEIINSPEKVGELRDLLGRIGDMELGVSADAMGGLFANVKYLGVSLTESAQMSVFANIDRENVDVGVGSPNSMRNNESMINAMALESREFALTYASSVIPGGEFGIGPLKANLVLGMAARVINGRTYYLHEELWDYDLEGHKIQDAIEEFTSENEFDETEFSADLGALLTLGDRASVGLTAKNITEPKFGYGIDGEKKGDVRLDAQYRLGAAFRPLKNWLIAADVDLAENDSGIEGYSYRTISIGTEVNLVNNLVAFRLGAYDNMAEKSRPFVTGGFGLSAKFVTFDIAGGFGTSSDDDYSLSASLGAKL